MDSVRTDKATVAGFSSGAVRGGVLRIGGNPCVPGDIIARQVISVFTFTRNAGQTGTPAQSPLRTLRKQRAQFRIGEVAPLATLRCPSLTLPMRTRTSCFTR